MAVVGIHKKQWFNVPTFYSRLSSLRQAQAWEASPFRKRQENNADLGYNLVSLEVVGHILYQWGYWECEV